MPTRGPAVVRHRRRLITAIKGSLRELSNQLSLLNHHVGSRVDLKDVDLDCLELVNRHGPMSPSDLARSAGLHPATLPKVEYIAFLQRDSKTWGDVVTKGNIKIDES